jgi:molybdenum-dependent DNA-binding transcriptional regulator ModE
LQKEWRKIWYPIGDSTDKTINKELVREYKTVEEKLKKSTNIQTDKLKTKGNSSLVSLIKPTLFSSVMNRCCSVKVYNII